MVLIKPSLQCFHIHWQAVQIIHSHSDLRKIQHSVYVILYLAFSKQYILPVSPQSIQLKVLFFYSLPHLSCSFHCMFIQPILYYWTLELFLIFCYDKQSLILYLRWHTCQISFQKWDFHVKGKHIYDFGKHYQMPLHRGCTILHSYQQYMRTPISF